MDSGSVDNYITSNVVEKLELLVTHHPTLYKVSWINSSSSQDITHQCLVTFSFPNFEDTVLCDVIYMTATKLLLGQSWQYDVRTVQNCFENTYTFYKDGKKRKSCIPLTLRQFQCIIVMTTQENW